MEFVYIADNLEWIIWAKIQHFPTEQSASAAKKHLIILHRKNTEPCLYQKQGYFGLPFLFSCLSRPISILCIQFSFMGPIFWAQIILKY